VVIDNGAGSSPTSGWGKLGPEDLPNPLTPLLDIVFYCVLIWIFWKAIRVLLGKEKPRGFLAVAPLFVIILAFIVVGYLSYR
jgi:hypothetical protein